MTTALPSLRRLRYFHGQMLGATDLQREQKYFRERLKLHNRCAHGFGVACGLAIRPVPRDDRCTDEEAGQPRVRIEPGVAIDCLGNEIVVTHPCQIDLWRHLSAVDLKAYQPKTSTLYVSIAYDECKVERTPGVSVDGCGGISDCEYGWCQETYRISVTLRPPEQDDCGEPCCAGCADPRVLLAAVTGAERGQALTDANIDMSVRRPLSRYRFTTITGISWSHGGEYERDAVTQMLQQDGLIVRFSKPVRRATLVSGIVDVRILEGGGGRNSNVWYAQGDLRLPNEDLTDMLHWVQGTDEVVQRSDRINVIVRTPFILDRCCRPVDGTHVGGRVPLLPGYRPAAEPPTICERPPPEIAPWTSGADTGAGGFESWFTVRGRP
jgi:hypothetical protein